MKYVAIASMTANPRMDNDHVRAFCARWLWLGREKVPSSFAKTYANVGVAAACMAAHAKPRIRMGRSFHVRIGQIVIRMDFSGMMSSVLEFLRFRLRFGSSAAAIAVNKSLPPFDRADFS